MYAHDSPSLFNKTRINFSLRRRRWSLYSFHGIEVTADCKSEPEEETEKMKRRRGNKGGRGTMCKDNGRGGETFFYFLIIKSCQLMGVSQNIIIHISQWNPQKCSFIPEHTETHRSRCTNYTLQHKAADTVSCGLLKDQRAESSVPEVRMSPTMHDHVVVWVLYVWRLLHFPSQTFPYVL